MSSIQESPAKSLWQRFNILIVLVLAAGIFLITWYGIKESRVDSFELLVSEGTAFTEALAQASEGAIHSEQVIDFFVHLRYSEILGALGPDMRESPTNELLMKVARDHEIYGIFVFDEQANIIAGAATRTVAANPPDFVIDEVQSLIESPESNYALLLDDDTPGQVPLHYYLEITNTLDRVILIINDASTYVDAMSQTQIGYLAQNMTKEQGVEYIIFQTSEGIVFSSAKTDRLLAIESDPFLSEALNADSICHRENNFEGETVLELVRPFSSPDFRFGLLRVGLSLDKYYAVTRGYDLRMYVIAAVLLALVLIIVKYFDSRRRRLESELRYQEIKTVTDKIFEQMRTGVAAIDSMGNITLVNEAFEKIVEKNQLVGQNWGGVFTDSLISLENIAPSGTRPSETEVALSFGGKRKTLLVAASKLSSESSSDQGTIIVLYDITRIKEFEQESTRRERLSEMGQLAAGVAHEIRNPLNSISIAAQRLAAEFVPNENSDEFQSITSNIRSETKRLDNIITRFLALARSEKKNVEPVNLEKFFKEDAAFLKLEANQIGIELELDIESNLIVNTDRESLMQVVTNLFNNAKEALNGSSGKIKFSASQVDNSIHLVFSDSGPGVPDEIRNDIFKPFFTTKENGTGLGLPTVHRIVNELGGEIKLNRSKSGGAEFVLKFKKN